MQQYSSWYVFAILVGLFVIGICGLEFVHWRA